MFPWWTVLILCGCSGAAAAVLVSVFYRKRIELIIDEKDTAIAAYKEKQL